MSDAYVCRTNSAAERAGFVTRHTARRLLQSASLMGMAATSMVVAQSASAQATPTPNVVNACAGVSLPRSVVTDILSPVVGGIVTPLQNTVNPVLGVLGALLPLVPPLNIDAAGLLSNAAAGNPITLQVLNTNGTVVGPNDRCDVQSDSISLTNPQGISIGGNRITGLGTNGLEAVAGEGNSIAFGNSATTAASATGSLALGTRSSVGANAVGAVALGTGASATAANGVALGAGSVAARGPQSGYVAIGLPGTQNSAGEVSVGAVGAERQITNVAAGTAATDAATVGQVAGVAAQVAALGNVVQYDDATKSVVTLGGGAGGTKITNVAAGSVAAGSTDAVNGDQLNATNGQVTTNTTSITNLGNQIFNGAIGPVQYSSPGSLTTPNGGTQTNDLTLVGAAAGAVGLHNVAAGSIGAGSTDAVNGGQLFTTNQTVTTVQGTAEAALILGQNSVQYDNPAKTSITLGGTGGTKITNVTAGTVAAGSTDAINGDQLNATNVQVTNNTSSITNLGNQIFNGAIGPVQYSSPGSLTTPNGGTQTNDLTLVGAAAGPVGLHNVAAGSIAAGSTDAVNGDQVYALARTTANAVSYDTDTNGLRLNTVTLIGGNTAAPVKITNVAAGTLAAGSVDAVNGGQLFTTNQAVATAQSTADTALTLGQNSVQYDNAAKSSITLGGASGTKITNVAAGTVAAGSTDAVNGDQLNATNVQVTNNTTAITNLGNQISNGALGPVQYSNPGSTTTPNGGTRTNDLTLVGAAAGPVGLHNVAAGSIAAGSTDAVNGDQVYALAKTSANAVSYDTDANGVRTNTVTLAGGNAAAPVKITNVAAGTLAAGSVDAVNGAQLYATNQAVAGAQDTANTALTLGANSVQYGAGRTNVTFNAGGTATVLSNVAAGVSTTDAVNLGQLNAGINSAVTQANSYTDARISALNFDLRSVRRDSFAGTSGALAAAGLPQAYEAGKGMVAIGGGTYGGQSAFAVGLSKAFNDGHTVVKLSGTYDSQGKAGASGGVGYQF